MADGSVDAVSSVGALADATDVEVLLTEIKRVLRPGGRLIFVEPVAADANRRLRWMQGALNGVWAMLAGNLNPPRDLWNDLKAARFGRLAFERRDLRGTAGLPVPHLVGEAVLLAAPPALAAPPRRSPVRAPALTWREPAFTFFG